MMQYHVSKGLKVFGKEGTDAVLSELKQLHEHMVMDPKRPEKCLCKEKRDLLQYLMFLTKKRCSHIKGCGYTYSQKQITCMPNDDTSAPIVVTEALMFPCIIDTLEGRDVVTVDIPDTIMQADMDDIVHMKIEGTMSELLTKIDPKLYQQYFQNEK
eukprot:10974255-Ditylum_brightwellii.AAC.1